MNKTVDIIPERNVNETKGKGRCSHNDFMTMVRNNCSARIVFVDGKMEIIPQQPVSNKDSGGGHE